MSAQDKARTMRKQNFAKCVYYPMPMPEIAWDKRNAFFFSLSIAFIAARTRADAPKGHQSPRSPGLHGRMKRHIYGLSVDGASRAPPPFLRS